VSVVLLRHARAGERGAWSFDDRLRPLDERGREQAAALRDVLSSRAIDRIVSSPYLRCIETVEPLADVRGLRIEPDVRLAEGAAQHDALSLLSELEGGLACTHGDVIEGLLGYGLRKGAAVVIDVKGDEVIVRAALPAP
jgi:8-oxo-dGTP diphosphatase